MINRVKRILSKYSNMPTKKMTLESSLIGDLGLSSLDLVNVIVAFEDEFDVEISDDEIRNIQTINDIINKLHEKTMQ